MSFLKYLKGGFLSDFPKFFLEKFWNPFKDEPVTDVEQNGETSLALTNDPEVESLKSETVALDSLRSEIESHSEK